MEKVAGFVLIAYHLAMATYSPPPQSYIEELGAHRVEMTRSEKNLTVPLIDRSAIGKERRVI